MKKRTFLGIAGLTFASILAVNFVVNSRILIEEKAEPKAYTLSLDNENNKIDKTYYNGDEFYSYTSSGNEMPFFIEAHYGFCSAAKILDAKDGCWGTLHMGGAVWSDAEIQNISSFTIETENCDEKDFFLGAMWGPDLDCGAGSYDYSDTDCETDKATGHSIFTFNVTHPGKQSVYFCFYLYGNNGVPGFTDLSIDVYSVKVQYTCE